MINNEKTIKFITQGMLRTKENSLFPIMEQLFDLMITKK